MTAQVGDRFSAETFQQIEKCSLIISNNTGKSIHHTLLFHPPLARTHSSLHDALSGAHTHTTTETHVARPTAAAAPQAQLKRRKRRERTENVKDQQRQRGKRGQQREREREQCTTGIVYQTQDTASIGYLYRSYSYHVMLRSSSDRK